jgi:hypothetical protein
MGGGHWLTKLHKASPTAEIFPDANAMFTKIQDLFCSRDKNVVFHGQYSIPEVAVTLVNEEVAQAPPSTNEVIICIRSTCGG